MIVRVVSPWYPDYATPHSGIFVAKQVSALRSAVVEVAVEVPQVFPAPAGAIPLQVTDAMTDLASKNLAAMFHSHDGVTYVPTPVPSRAGPMGRSEAMASSLRNLRRHHQDGAEIIHAHLGIPTAWAVVNSSPDLPLVVTEHQSTLANVLSEPRARAVYAELVENADAFICVSSHLREVVSESLGRRDDHRIEVVPNIVDLTEIEFIDRPSNPFQSWIYVGGLVEHKGIRLLLHSFADYQERYDDRATLTLVGRGPLQTWVERFATKKGLGAAISLSGVVDHSQLSSYLYDSDVMVHLSPAETFGIAHLEAIGAGVPVVGLRNAGAVSSWGSLEGECGTLLPLDASPAAVSDAVATLRAEPQRLNLRKGRKHIEDRYTPAIVAGQLRAIYDRVRR